MSFLKFKAKMVQTQFSKAIKKFQRDNAMKYRDSKLLPFLGEQGTLSEFSRPYTSQENGRAERKYPHILDLVCTMLISASYLECTCVETILIVIHIINGLHYTILSNDSPF